MTVIWPRNGRKFDGLQPNYWLYFDDWLGQRFFSSSPLPHRIWTPPMILSSSYHVSSPVVKTAGA